MRTSSTDDLCILNIYCDMSGYMCLRFVSKRQGYLRYHNDTSLYRDVYSLMAFSWFVGSFLLLRTFPSRKHYRCTQGDHRWQQHTPQAPCRR